MREYYVQIGEAVFTVMGCEAAYEAFRAACQFGTIIGQYVCLVDSETAEVLADNEGEV